MEERLRTLYPILDPMEDVINWQSREKQKLPPPQLLIPKVRQELQILGLSPENLASSAVLNHCDPGEARQLIEGKLNF